MKYYPEGDPSFYIEKLEAHEKANPRNLEKKWLLRKVPPLSSYVYHWADFTAANVKEIDNKLLCMKDRLKDRRKLGAILPLNSRGVSAFKMTRRPPAGFLKAKAPLTLAELEAGKYSYIHNCSFILYFCV